MQAFLTEIFEQPAALIDLLNHYDTPDLPQLQADLAGYRVLFVGMGASYHAALVAAYQPNAPFRAQVADALDLLNYNLKALDEADVLVYLSQSGASGEIIPLFDQLPVEVKTIGITNHVKSPLGERATQVLALHAGDEKTVATKTYINSLALLNLLYGTTPQTVRDTSAQIDTLLQSSDEICALWLDSLADTSSLYFVGHGPHSVTARHCAMMVGEWAKRPVCSASIGAFRHGFIEAVEPGMGVVIFAPPGSTQQSAHTLADELLGYGANVLLVENGLTRRAQDASVLQNPVDEFLSPMLDVIPAQLFAEALARHRGITTGFRYISKVVSRI